MIPGRGFGGAARLIILATCCWTLASGMECFVCSYSPRGASSRIDGCTWDNFTEEVINTKSCDLGCETVAVYDINGSLESFLRNCAQPSTAITYTCETYSTPLLTKTVCSCDWDLCNPAALTRRPSEALSWLGVVALLLTFR